MIVQLCSSREAHVKSREQWLAEIQQRQSNIDPIKRIPNSALFQGTLIKGGRVLTPFQRLAAAVMGILIMFGGCYGVADSIGLFLRKATTTDVLASLISGGFAALLVGLGFKITLNALVTKAAAKQPLGLKKKYRV